MGMIEKLQVLKMLDDMKAGLNQNRCENEVVFIEIIRKKVEGMKGTKLKDDWIPCSERLPEESGYYFACIYNQDVDDFDFRKTWFAHVDDYDMEESEWRELYNFEKVTAWKPLPEPYKTGTPEEQNPNLMSSFTRLE